MKKIASLLSVCALALGLAACGSDNASPKTEDKKELKIGATTGPYADMVKEAIKPGLEDLGYKIEIVEFTDYIQPNKSLGNNSIDANLFQHKVYMDNFAKENDLELSDLVIVPTAPMGIYSNKYKSLKDIKDGTSLALPNDPVNLARALKVLVDEDLIEVKPDVDPLKVSEKDVTKNPKNIQFKPLESAQLPRATDSVDLSAVPGNFALAAKMDLQDALVLENMPDMYRNVVAVNTKDADAQFAKDIKSVVESDKFEEVIDSKFAGFGKPDWMK
ncbi:MULTISPECIES: MetQ/NlpA family ABC transporter substrate-binding protein [Peribacillus]|uniref:MetQ/NlpA family ABC transporter substrate-binding protein n=1 Tax=Peribacillus TaxID=2675229 RepID=UPI0028689B85|nr:MetQ/NlpA family ABC transporter substrate-binding protein [Peribacillus sp. R9-11]WMX56807.1 MetQ/NlpA family ABC transporter substrate-binding protein [Peribacillus sp. R9-11]